MSVSYDNSMYTTIPPEFEWDNPLCYDCPYAEDSLCWTLGCIKEKD